MQPHKTAVGQQVLKDRSVPLSPRQRAAFILIDGKRSLSEVLQQTAAAGVTREDVDQLLALGLIAADPAPTRERPAQPAPADARSRKERYAAAYPLATQLTAGLGLRGLRLNLAVEKATGFDELFALAPKILEAVGPDKFAPLQEALGSAPAAAGKD